MSFGSLITLIFFLCVFYIPNLSLDTVFVLLFLGGMASGGQILYLACAKEINPNHISGTVVGFINCGVMVSGLIFQPLLGFLLDFAWEGSLNPDGTRFYSLYSYKVAFSAVSIALLLSWILVQFIKETHPNRATLT
jgi:MFS family permease